MVLAELTTTILLLLLLQHHDDHHHDWTTTTTTTIRPPCPLAAAAAVAGAMTRIATAKLGGLPLCNACAPRPSVTEGCVGRCWPPAGAVDWRIQGHGAGA